MTVGDFRGLLDTTNETQQNMDKFLEYTSQNDIKPTVKAYQDWAVNVQGLGKQFSFATVKAIALNVANAALNATISFGIGALVQLAITGIDKIIHAYDNLKEETEQLNEEYQSIISEMETVRGELNTTGQKIDELENKGSLSLVEQNELDKLRETNIELERQIANLETIAKAKQKESVKSAVELYNTPNPDMLNIFSFNNEVSESAATNNLSEQVDFLLERIYSLQHEIDNPDLAVKQKEKLQKRLDAYETMLGTGMEALSEIDLPAGYSESTDRIIAEIDEAMYRIRKYFGEEIPRDLLMERFGYTEEAKKTINELSEAEAEALTLYEGDIKSYTEFPKILAEIKNSSSAATEALNNTDEGTKTLLDTLSEASSGIGTLNSAFEDFQENGTLSFSSLKKIQDEFKDVSGIEDYISQLGSAELTSEQLNSILNELTYKYLEQKISIVDLAEADETLIAKMLEEQGVSNSLAVAHDLITYAKEKLSRATETSIESMTKELIQMGLSEEMAKQLATSYVNCQSAMTGAALQEAVERLNITQVELQGIQTVAQAYDLLSQKRQDTINESKNTWSVMGDSFAEQAFEDRVKGLETLSPGEQAIVDYAKQVENLTNQLKGLDVSSSDLDDIYKKIQSPEYGKDSSEFSGDSTKYSSSSDSSVADEAKKASDALDNYNKSVKDNAEKLSNAEEQYAKAVEDANERRQDAYETYNDTITDIEKSLDELNKEERLANLQYQIELVNQELEKFSNELSMLDTKIGMSFEGDYIYKLQNIGQQFKTAAQYSMSLRTEIDKLITTMPANADEANALADQLEQLGEEYYQNQRLIIEYRKEATDARASALEEIAELSGRQSSRLSEIVNRSVDIMENGSVIGDFFSMPLLSSVSKDAVERQRDENDALIAEEKRYREEIAKIRTNATTMEKQESDAEREQKRAEYRQQALDAQAELQETLASIDETMVNAHDTLLQTVSDIDSSLNDSFQNYSNSVNGAVQTTKKAINDIVNYADSAQISIDVQAYVSNIESKYSDSKNIDHKARGGSVNGMAIVNERGLESVILPDGTFHLLKDYRNNGKKMIANFPNGSHVLNANDTKELLQMGMKDGDKIAQYANGSIGLSSLYNSFNNDGSINSLRVQRFSGKKSTKTSESSNTIIGAILNEIQAAFDNMEISVDNVKQQVIDQFNDSEWRSAMTQAIEGDFNVDSSTVQDGVMGTALSQSSWDSLPNEMQESLAEDLQVTKDTWSEWVSSPENALIAVQLCRDNSVSSWDLLSPTMVEIITQAGIDTKESWDKFVEENPMQALVLLISSWEALKEQIQQYMNDMIAIATNGAEAIHAIQIAAPGISQESWDNLQTVIANKIQEVLNAINETFKENNVDLNFNINTSLPGNSQTYPQGAASGTAQGNALVETAKQYLGVPYLWGGTTPSGFDCSGLMQYVYRENGINISRTTYTQIEEGTAVDRESLQPGDLVFFGSWENPHHVGMYIGNGQFLHAPQTGDVVKISALDSRNDFVTGRRIINSYYTGTGGAKSGYATVGDGNAVKGDFVTPAPELIFKKSGGAYLAGLNGTEIVHLDAGDTVVPHEETMRILKKKNASVGSGRFNSYAKGTSSNNDDIDANVTRIDVPDGLGTVYSYMAWRTVTREGTKQLALKQQSGENYDSEGYARIGNRYVVAMTDTFGGVGDYVNIYMADGRVIEAVIGDIKDQTWAHGIPANHWGHYDGQGVVEWITNWGDHENPPSNGAVLYVDNLGNNYFGDPAFAGQATLSSNNRIYNLILQKLNELIGTVSTNTDTGGMKWSGYKRLSGRQSNYDFETPFTNLNKRADGGFVDENLTTVVNELGEESVEHTDGSIDLLGKTPKLYRLRKGDRIYNAKDTAYLKKYFGNNLHRAKVQKFASGSDRSTQIGEYRPELFPDDYVPSVDPTMFSDNSVTITENASGDSYSNYGDGSMEIYSGDMDYMSGYMGSSETEREVDYTAKINEFLNEDEQIKQGDYEREDTEIIYNALENLRTDEKISRAQLDAILETEKSISKIDEWLEFTYTDMLAQRDNKTRKDYQEQQAEYRKWQRDFTDRFFDFLESENGRDDIYRFFDFGNEAFKKQTDVVIKQAETAQEYLRETISIVSEERDKAYALLEMAVTADEQQRVAEVLESLDENLLAAQNDYNDFEETIRQALVNAITVANSEYLSALSYEDKHLENIDRNLEKAYTFTERDTLYDEAIKANERERQIAQEQMDSAHMRNDVIYNTTDTIERWLLDNIKTTEVFDANGETNSYYEQEIAKLNSLVDEGVIGSEYVQTYQTMIAQIGENKKIWYDVEDKLEAIADNTDTLTNEKINNIIDAYVAVQEEIMSAIEFRLEKNQLQYDAKSMLYDFQQTLTQNKLDAQIEIKANKELEQWLDPETRKLLFNDDDYSEYIEGINRINKDIEDGYNHYIEQINSLTPEESYREAEITAEWQRQLEIKQEELEVLQDEMEIAKKTLEYNNAAKERDTQIILGNRVVNVADPERLHELSIERENAISQAEVNQMTHANNADLRNIEAINDATQTELNAYQQRIDMINEMTEAERKAWVESLPSIEYIQAFYSAFTGTPIRFLNETINDAFEDAFNVTLTERGNKYDAGIDYQVEINTINDMVKRGVLSQEIADNIIERLTYPRNEKTATSQPYSKYYTGERPEEYGSFMDELMDYKTPYGDLSDEDKYLSLAQERKDILNYANSHGGFLTQGELQRLNEIESTLPYITRGKKYAKYGETFEDVTDKHGNIFNYQATLGELLDVLGVGGIIRDNLNTILASTDAKNIKVSAKIEGIPGTVEWSTSNSPSYSTSVEDYSISKAILGNITSIEDNYNTVESSILDDIKTNAMPYSEDATANIKFNVYRDYENNRFVADKDTVEFIPPDYASAIITAPEGSTIKINDVPYYVGDSGDDTLNRYTNIKVDKPSSFGDTPLKVDKVQSGELIPYTEEEILNGLNKAFEDFSIINTDSAWTQNGQVMETITKDWLVDVLKATSGQSSSLAQDINNYNFGDIKLENPIGNFDDFIRALTSKMTQYYTNMSNMTFN